MATIEIALLVFLILILSGVMVFAYLVCRLDPEVEIKHLNKLKEREALYLTKTQSEEIDRMIEMYQEKLEKKRRRKNGKHKETS